MTHVVLEETGFGIRAAVLLEGRLIEIRDGDRDDLRVTDALFAARVTSVDTKLNAAFIDCGLSRPGLLVAKDARAAVGSSERRPIRELVHEGQRLLVQGVREPVDDKGARFTTDIKLFGNALVHTPFGQTLDGAPPRGRRQGEQLRERGRALFPGGDFALRRHAATLPDELLRAEAVLDRELALGLHRALADLPGPSARFPDKFGHDGSLCSRPRQDRGQCPAGSKTALKMAGAAASARDAR